MEASGSTVSSGRLDFASTGRSAVHATVRARSRASHSSNFPSAIARGVRSTALVEPAFSTGHFSGNAASSAAARAAFAFRRSPAPSSGRSYSGSSALFSRANIA